jgi:hypothetical protein
MCVIELKTVQVVNIKRQILAIVIIAILFALVDAILLFHY